MLTSSKVLAISGVQMGPGATALTLMPLLTSWLDRERVKANCRSMGHIGYMRNHVERLLCGAGAASKYTNVVLQPTIDCHRSLLLGYMSHGRAGRVKLCMAASLKRLGGGVSPHLSALG
jgi:hypothetical protein